MLTPDVELIAHPVLEFTSAQVTDAMNRSFEEYMVPMVFTPVSFERRFRGEHLDAEASKLWFRGEKLIGVVFIARRGWTSRVAAMGLVRDERGKQYGRQMLQSAINEAIARGDRSMLLEVFAANERARRLYERLGFRNERELFSFRHVPTPKSPPAARRELQEIDPAEVARLVLLEGEPNISWMYAPETLTGAATPSRAFQLDEKAYVMLRQDPDRTLLQTLLVRPEHRRQGRGRELLQAVEAAFPEKPLVISMLASGPLYSFLQAMQWELMPLPLFEMVRPL
ncbi:GNAT family N-acetyltransferase [Hymenobacter sp. BT188]|uniref:GNAT family N-acetyltransferase n=1 Tax=Hymenobacter sp. BT188 TaxID=2763504 RepID=UPI0016513CDA|nr:GNAT family N-acetyltransferase [Hymenobacter sp. BT188]MBC6607929.1 GNAT family N-acetyltransferase [Hymenobacter sp. BT188]